MASRVYSWESVGVSEFISIRRQPTTMKIHADRKAHAITVQRAYQKAGVSSNIMWLSREKSSLSSSLIFSQDYPGSRRHDFQKLRCLPRRDTADRFYHGDGEDFRCKYGIVFFRIFAKISRLRKISSVHIKHP